MNHEHTASTSIEQALGEPGGHQWKLEQALAIVVGSRPSAELDDRPVARLLADRICRIQDNDHDVDMPLKPITVSDLWYLNDDRLRLRPTITIGSPEENAATAWLASRLEQVYVIENCFCIQMDPELLELQVCLWGREASGTRKACSMFLDRYLPEYLHKARLTAV